jgi:hypothetical protein
MNQQAPSLSTLPCQERTRGACASSSIKNKMRHLEMRSAAHVAHLDLTGELDQTSNQRVNSVPINYGELHWPLGCYTCRTTDHPTLTHLQAQRTSRPAHIVLQRALLRAPPAPHHQLGLLTWTLKRPADETLKA